MSNNTTSLWQRVLTGALLTGALALTIGCVPAEPEIAADLVLQNGKIFTVDPNVPDGEAIAVLDDTILAVGSDREIRQYIGSNTEVIDLDGQLAIPGFIDGHAHFMGVGRAQMQLNLMQVANWNEIVAMVGDAVSDLPAGATIIVLAGVAYFTSLAFNRR